MTYIIKKEDSTILKLYIQPGAKKSEIVGVHGDRLKIRLNAPPVDGKANKELIRFLAKTFDIKKSEIKIIVGLKNRQKDVRISGQIRCALCAVRSAQEKKPSSREAKQ